MTEDTVVSFNALPVVLLTGGDLSGVIMFILNSREFKEPRYQRRVGLLIKLLKKFYC